MVSPFYTVVLRHATFKSFLMRARKFITLITLVAAALAVVACGQKGPLRQASAPTPLLIAA